MKKLIAIAGAAMILWVLISAQAYGTETAEVPVQATQATVYVMREENDRVVVYQGDSVWLRTDTPVSSLPKSDRVRLREGILLTSEEELRQMLEDFCS